MLFHNPNIWGSIPQWSTALLEVCLLQEAFLDYLRPQGTVWPSVHFILSKLFHPALATVLPFSVLYRDATWILLDTGARSPSEPRPLPSSAMRKTEGDVVSALQTPLLCLF